MPNEHGADGSVASRYNPTASDLRAMLVALVDSSGNLASSSGNFPSGAISAAAGAVGANSASNASIAAVAAKTNYLSGFKITGLGATAASVVTVTVTGLLGGTLTFYLAIPANVAAQIDFEVNLPVPLAASAVNTAITVNVPAFGAGSTNQAVAVFGYTQ